MSFWLSAWRDDRIRSKQVATGYVWRYLNPSLLRINITDNKNFKKFVKGSK
jgi:hypothetical protein